MRIMDQNKEKKVVEDEIDEILQVIKIIYGYDFTEYSKASVRRRLNNFMIMNDIQDLNVLKRQVSGDDQVFRDLLESLTVTVTEMFRDPDLYLALREKVLPTLDTWPFIRIWHAGCSTGEEVYSMAILLKEEGLLHKARIYATDINSKALSEAKKGETNISLMKDYTRNYIQAGGKSNFSEYYTVKGNKVYWDPSLAKNITFSLHNLVSDKSFNEFNLIICRNVMIYFNRNLQNKVTKLFKDSLTLFGYLVLGNKESMFLSSEADFFETIDKHEKIFQRVK